MNFRKCSLLGTKKKRLQIAIGKFNTTEIDFIATKADLKYYYQICYLLTEDNAKREFSPLENVKDNFEKTVIAPNKFINSQYNGIVQKNIIDFLLEKQGENHSIENSYCLLYQISIT